MFLDNMVNECYKENFLPEFAVLSSVTGPGQLSVTSPPILNPVKSE